MPLYPWRTIDGAECSTHYPTGAAQYHLNADIAYAVELYIAASGDRAFASRAAEMVFETARIWMQVGHHDARRNGAFVINGVTGPDEYSALVNNDYYTNAMAAKHLRFAHHLATDLAARETSTFEAIATKIALSADEAEQWVNAAEHMWLPIDPEIAVHPQDDSFLGRAPFPFEKSADGPLLLSHHPLQLFRYQICKQGDVVQAHALIGYDISKAQKHRDFQYYEPLTTHDSTLSATAFGMVACEIGDYDAALKFHRETAFVDLENRHGNSHHGMHMAALAGSWQMLVHGWAGARIIDDGLWFSPHCPPAWTDYTFRLTWQGTLFCVRVDRHGAEYTHLSGKTVTVFDHGRRIELLPEKPVCALRPRLKAVIFDLDGVLTDTADGHFQAWMRLCNEEELPFSRELNERLKGVDRRSSFEIILEAAGETRTEEQIAELLDRKNAYYRQSIAAYSPENLFAGAQSLLENCLRAGLRIGLASASKNARDVVNALGIARLFDTITDAGSIANGKPDPEIFLKTASALGVSPDCCLGVEDARAGVSAIKSAGMTAVGIGSETELREADVIVQSVSDLSAARLHSIFEQANQN